MQMMSWMFYKKIATFFFIVLSYAQTYPQIGSNETLDIVTWNIENFPKNTQTINYLSEIINDINVDIIALQEIESENAFEDLINNLNGSWAGYRADDGNWGELCYLVNTDNVQITHYPFTILDEYEHYYAYRTPYVIKIRFSNEEFVIINVHYKCCGDGFVDNDYWDEEYRRLIANQYLKDYIDYNLDTDNVLILGDYNDDIAESSANNVFNDFLFDDSNYLFADLFIAQGPSSDWSFPNWPSHLDHILITNELFDNISDNSVFTFKIDDYMNGWWEYENLISDHRPVVINLKFDMLGDINFDGAINVLDVTILINMILNNDFSEIVDLNVDLGLNILDVILLIDLILS